MPLQGHGRATTGRSGSTTTLHEDLAWSYAFPTREILPIAGLIAFYNEKVDIVLDGQLLERPITHFASEARIRNRARAGACNAFTASRDDYAMTENWDFERPAGRCSSTAR